MDIIDIITKNYDIIFEEETKFKFAQILNRREFDKNELILEQGQVSRHFYIVESGLIRQFYYKNGRDVTEHFSHEEKIASCIESLFLGTPTNLMVEAIEPSVVHLIGYDDWKALCNEKSSINRLYHAVLERQLIISQRKADSWRFENASERYDRFCRDYPEAAKRASIADIASYLLMSSETLSRVRAGTL